MGSFQSALLRQVSEAVRITVNEKKPGVSVLNVKGTYNRCSLPTMVLQQYDKVVSETVQEEQGEQMETKGGETAKRQKNHQER